MITARVSSTVRNPSTLADALRDELAFWERYIATGGLDWPDEFLSRTAPDPELRESEILCRLPHTKDPIRVLDVGSGPLTVLGTRAGSRRIELVGVDPLADEYNDLLAMHGIQPSVRSIRGSGEHLTQLFRENTFDFAYARNSLDHTADPLRTIRQMLAITKFDGWVILRHRPNEGANAGYIGLHQWNLCVEEAQLWLWNPHQRYNLHTVLSRRAAVAYTNDGEWLVCALRKLPTREQLTHYFQICGGRVRRRARRTVRTFLRNINSSVAFIYRR